MHYLSPDYLIVYAFLLITLVIGLRSGRGIKDVREYATANKSFGTGTLVLTWLATDIAGETVLDMTGSVRTVGIIQPLTVFWRLWHCDANAGISFLPLSLYVLATV